MTRRAVALCHVAAAAWLGVAQAQQLPDAGRMLKDVPPAPVPQTPAPAMPLPAQPAPLPPPAARDAFTFELRGVVFKGNTVFGADELSAYATDFIGKRVGFADLEAITRRITEHYRRAGYALAQALLPAQNIKDGVVEISILEGRLGKVRLNRAPETPVSESFIVGILSGMPAGQPITQRDLERTLLLLSDVPGMRIESALEPGDEPGSTDLVVDVYPGPRLLLSVDADNHGSHFTGEYRGGLFARVNSPLGLGDNLDLRLFTSSGAGQLYGRAGYELPVNRHGTRFGVGIGQVAYELGKDFQALDAHGTAQVFDASMTHPFIRARARNLFGRLGFENKRLEDNIDVVSSTTVKTVRNLSAGLAYEGRDALFGGGYTSGSGSVYFGDLDIKSPDALAADQSAVGRHTNGSFTRFAYQVSRLQSVAGPLSAYVGVTGQLASKNLDSAEQISIGGPRAVRAYSTSELLADIGAVMNAELRYSVAPNVTLSGFYDLGWGRVSKNPPPGAGDNERTLRGFGVGMYWVAPWRMSVQASVAWRDSEAAQSGPDRVPRIYVQVVQPILP